jgi:hypothetical protein
MEIAVKVLLFLIMGMGTTTTGTAATKNLLIMVQRTQMIPIKILTIEGKS